MTRLLRVGESCLSAATHHKGFDGRAMPWRNVPGWLAA